jgi:hypothetical protein
MELMKLIYVITALYEQPIEEQYKWWSSFTNVTYDDIMHQHLSVNRSYSDSNEQYKSTLYKSRPIPARYTNWQAWVITTRWNNNAERYVKELT